MTHTPTPAEIETLRRKAKHHDLDCTRSPWASYCSCGADEALAILDRLSPPAPEVDEATRIWREIHVHEELAMGARGQINKKFRNGDYDNDKFGQGGIAYLRTALSELIASKDAEREKQNKQLLAVAQGYKLDKEEAEAELTALRAEKERLKASQLVIRKVEPAPFQFDEAAERDPAEPLASLGLVEPEIGGWTSKAKYVDTAPVVEVTVDRQREKWARNIASYTEGQARNHVYKCAINLLTEAEARGRREALDAVRKLREKIKDWDRSKYAARYILDAVEEELKRMMTGEK